MINFILESLQLFVNLIFLAVVVGTLGISALYAGRLKKRYNAPFPWSKTAAIVGIEVLLWIGFNIFFEAFQANWLWISIASVILIVLIVSRKKRKYT